MAFEQMRSQAERDVRGAILLDRVAEAENVEVSDAEIEEEIAKIAAQYRATPDEIRDSLKKQGGENTIKNNLRTRKSIEALVAHAKVAEGKWKDPSETEDAEPAKPKKAAAAKGKKAEGGEQTKSAKTKS